eukprot:COSAG05_NODE_1064_length_5991_cov_12.180414_3_plen_95_part_00
MKNFRMHVLRARCFIGDYLLQSLALAGEGGLRILLLPPRLLALLARGPPVLRASFLLLPFPAGAVLVLVISIHDRPPLYKTAGIKHYYPMQCAQ